MDFAGLAYAIGYLIGVALVLYLQYLIIKYAVYSGIKRYENSRSENAQYEIIRDAVAAGMLTHDEYVKEDNNKKEK